jgi:beta-lactamase superfamily II metal-dependent hydrolase
MADYFEIDFLDIEAKKSGDAIPLRYELNGVTWIHLVDGGYQACGEKIVNHLRTYYTNQDYIDKVVVTHPDGDHAGGLRTVLQEVVVKELWMLRPWEYAAELIPRFATYTSVERLKARLKSIYSNLAALEEIALEKGIPIREPFQGAQIGTFTVLAPSKSRYLDLIVESERTPESVEEAEETSVAALGRLIGEYAAKAVYYLKAAAWGEEIFSPEETSAENEMSVIQYANLCGQRILLTGDAGRKALAEAADYAPLAGLSLPGIDRFQVPHHGSRRNVSTELLDRWLGERLPTRPLQGQGKFQAMVSAAKEDTDHPRNAVIRALWHRGAYVVTTKTGDLRTGFNAPPRLTWVTAPTLDYPEEQEG